MRARSGWISIPVAVGGTMMLFAVWTQLSSSVGSAPPTYTWAFTPARIAAFLLRGHAPLWVQTLGALLAIGAFWAGAADLALAAAARLRRARDPLV